MRAVEGVARKSYTVFSSHLKPYFGSLNAAIAFLTSHSASQSSPLARIVSFIAEQAESATLLSHTRNNRNRIFDLARDLARSEAKRAGNSQAIAQLENDIVALDAQVKKMAACVDDLKKSAKISNEADKLQFNLIAAIAARLGFDDIVDMARDGIEAVGGELDPNLVMTPRVQSAQHFYLHATRSDIDPMLCESFMTVGDKVLDARERTRCAIHATYNPGSNQYKGRTWGNLTTTWHTGWSTRRHNSLASGLHKVDNGFKIFGMEPTAPRAKELAARKAEDGFVDWDSTLVLRVFGYADKFQIKVRNMSSRQFENYDVTVTAADFLAKRSSDINVYEIPLPKAISKLGACRWDREITIVALDSKGDASSEVVRHRIHTFSPVVLDFANRGMIETIPPLLSSVEFDLDGNGVKQNTGWIDGKSAFLALDRDNDGVISGGHELFGEATRMKSGERAENGYAALAEFDTNSDGVISNADPIYQELRLWFDHNNDGVSQKSELKSLLGMKIETISVRYKNVKESLVLQSGGLPEANLVKYESSYTGSDFCTKGCKSYDVFFGTSESTKLSYETK
jgi:Ca2+-binding EF-hand superfamily protein